MILRLEIAGRRYEISAERTESDGQFRISIGGHALEVNAARVDHRSWSLLLPDGSQHAVSVSGNPTSGFTVHLQTGDVPVTLSDLHRRSRDDSHRSAFGGGTGPARLLAPMPGKVVRVLVEAGQSVTAGQGVVVVEAMKMENELRAPRTGTVKQVAAHEGSSVEAGALLMVVE